MKNTCTILDYSPYDNPLDAQSDLLLAQALRAVDLEVEILPLSPLSAQQVEASLIWLRYDIRSRKDLLLILEFGRLLESRGKRMFPSPTVIWKAEDRWETYLAMKKAGVPVLPTFRGREFAACPYPAIFKARTGTGRLGSQVVPRQEDLTAHDIPTPAVFPDGSKVDGIMLRSPLKGQEYLCQPHIPHTRTLVVAVAGSTAFCCLEKGSRSALEERPIQPIPLTDDIRRISQAAFQAVGLITGTVELIETPEGLRVLELHTSPRLSYSSLPAIDLAGPMVKSLSNLLPV